MQNGETAPDPLPEEKDNINGMQQLSVEATSVNQAFREQVRRPCCRYRVCCVAVAIV